MKTQCTDCQDEDCIDEECRKVEQEVLDSKNLRYFRQGRSLDDLITEKLSEEDA